MLKCQDRKCLILIQVDIGLSSNVKVNITSDNINFSAHLKSQHKR